MNYATIVGNPIHEFIGGAVEKYPPDQRLEQAQLALVDALQDAVEAMEDNGAVEPMTLTNQQAGALFRLFKA